MAAILSGGTGGTGAGRVGAVRCSVFTEHRTFAIIGSMDESVELVVAAFAQLDIAVVASSGPGGDVVLDPYGIHEVLEIKRHSLVSVEVVRRELDQHRWRPLHGEEAVPVLILVGDRVTADARRLLLEARCGYVDLRGRVDIRSPRLLVGGDIEPLVERSGPRNPLATKAGLQVAMALLTNPERTVVVRELARELRRSPSTVSEVLSALGDDRLIDERRRVTDEKLFWSVADHWPNQRQGLAAVPTPGAFTDLTKPLKLGLEDVQGQEGWALTDLAAAGVWGAPVAVRADQPLDFFVPDENVARRARTLLGAARTAAEAACTIRVAPVPEICRRRYDSSRNQFEWPLAHPVVVALDLAQDRGRGREIVADWQSSSWWVRVW